MPEMFPSSAAAAEAAAHGVETALRAGLDTRGRASLVGTGGRSPGAVYDRLHAAHIDWARVIVTLSDERCVPQTSADSNAKLVRERLLTGPLARTAFVPLHPRTAETEPALHALLPFDAVLLGMGDDGHVASLFPNGPSGDGEGLTVDVPEGIGSPPHARISLTWRALLASHAIFLLIAGEAKRQVIQRARAGEDLPVGRLLAQDRVPVRVLWSPWHAD